MSEENIKKGFWLKIGLIPIGFFLFAFALVPIYQVLCDITGLNGNTSALLEDISNENVAKYQIDESREVSVDFTAFANAGFPVKLVPKVKVMNVIPGKIYAMEYIAENRSDKTIVGQAVPSVAPGHASLHFKKLECFCFEKQTFEPNVPTSMTVRFVVEPKLAKNIFNITLSYNFIKVEEPVAYLAN